jgi:hypothetical protein
MSQIIFIILPYCLSYVWNWQNICKGLKNHEKSHDSQLSNRFLSNIVKYWIGTWPFQRLLQRLRYHSSGLRVRVSPFCLPIFDVSIFTNNFYPFPRGKPLSTRKRQTCTGVFCLLFVACINSKNFQHLIQLNNAHMLVKLF